MDLFRLLDIFLHLDRVLGDVTSRFGAWTYAFLFAVLFCETGLVVTPFLPGDSLLFAVGALAAVDGLDLWAAFILLLGAAVLGDTVNYWIGHNLGVAFFNRPGKRHLIREEHLEKAKAFYAAHGGKTIVFARFVPIMRTLAPFVAGVARMPYRDFLIFNVAGGATWVSLFLFGGYFFGTIPVVKKNFTLVILAIIAVSLTPGIVAWVRSRKR